MDVQAIFSATLGPAAILVVAAILTRIAYWLTRRFENRYLEHDVDEMGRITRLQRGISGPEDLARGLREKRALTISSLIRGVSVVVIWVVALIVALELAGLPVTSVLAVAGVAGIALSFGAQSLVRDYISGFFIIFERQFEVGDTIQIAEAKGTVESVDLRTTVLRDIDGRRHVVPNGEIRVSTNYTHLFSRYPLVVPVPYEQDIDRVVEIIETTAKDLRASAMGSLITEPVNILGVDEFADSSVNLRLYLQTVPGRQWEVGREFRKRLKVALEADDISMPYPHRRIIVDGDSEESSSVEDAPEEA